MATESRPAERADLTSIPPTDTRDSVVARFAVIRRARQVARAGAEEQP